MVMLPEVPVAPLRAYLEAALVSFRPAGSPASLLTISMIVSTPVATTPVRRKFPSISHSWEDAISDQAS